MPEQRSRVERTVEQGLERRRERLVALGPALIALVGGLGSVLLWRTLQRGEVERARAAFELAATQLAARVQAGRMAAFEQLRSVAALYDSSMQVDAEEFRTFTANALERNAALRALMWIERGEHPSGSDERVGFAEGPERTSLARTGELGRASPASAALAHAAESDELSLSEPLQLPESEGTRVFAALPVRHHAGPRAGELHGYVALLLDVGRLLPADAREVSLRIEDVSGVAPILLAGEASAGSLSYSPDAEALGGRNWRIVCNAPPGFVSRHTSWWPLVVFLLGLLVTGSALATARMAVSRRSARALVERRSGEVMQSYATLASEAEERRHATREAKDSQEQLRQILDLVPSQVYVKDRHGRMLVANQATADAYGTTVKKLTLPAEVDFNADVGEPSEELREDRLLMGGNKSVIDPARPFVDGEGHRRLLHVAKIPCRVGGCSALLHVATDVTERRQAEEVVRSQNLLLGELARGAPPEEVLQHVIETAERLVAGLRCSVLFLGPDRRHLIHGLAPSLPPEYSQAIDGLEIGPLAGSCGAAAHLGQRFIVRDVLQHPNWAAYRELARRADIRACWSEPIRAADGEVLGTFAMYYSEPRTPELYEERFIESMAHLAGIAIERGQLGART
ncbi:MAG: GAF domain-containing protein [Planctomycetes bacterium]|nr:GAF domain-containing protein [Planctomycetota bacterium]